MLLEFDDVSISTERRELRRGGAVVAVQPQVFDLLLCLIGNRDHVVSRDELIEQVWNGRAVSESTLDSRVHAARVAIGDTGRAQRLLKTIHGKGFRFVGEPSLSAGSEAQAPRPDQSAPTRIAVLTFETDAACSGLAGPLRAAIGEALTRNPIGLLATDLGRGTGADTPLTSLAPRADYVVSGNLAEGDDGVMFAATLAETEFSTIVSTVRRSVTRAEPAVMLDAFLEAVINRLLQPVYAVVGPVGPSLEAAPVAPYDHVRLGMAINNRRTPADSEGAEAVVRAGLDRYPNFAPLHVLLAFIRLLRAYSLWAVDVGADLAMGRDAARRAVAIDGANAWAHQLLALALACLGQKEQAQWESERAVQCDPVYSGPYKNRSVTLSYLGRLDEALRDRRRATDMNPHAWPNDDLDWGRLLYLAGRHEDARPHLERYCTMAPVTDLVELLLAATLDELGEHARAATLVAQHRKALPWSSIALVAKVTPFPEPQRARFYDCLRRYGLPEA